LKPVKKNQKEEWRGDRKKNTAKSFEKEDDGGPLRGGERPRENQWEESLMGKVERTKNRPIE